MVLLGREKIVDGQRQAIVMLISVIGVLRWTRALLIGTLAHCAWLLLE